MSSLASGNSKSTEPANLEDVLSIGSDQIFVPSSSLKTLCDLIGERIRSSPALEALREFDHKNKEWVSLTYRELGERILTWQKSFAALGLKAGERAAMLLPNSINAVCFDQASMANRLVPVPLHAIDTPGSSAFILKDSRASFLITDRLSKWEKIKEAGGSFPDLKTVILTNSEHLSGSSSADPGTPQVLMLEEWLKSAAADAKLSEPPVEEDLACVIYTSGTTGQPKGVMLTHKNIVSNVKSTLAHVMPAPGEVFLSFLPLSHMFERTAGYYLALTSGCVIVYNRGLQYLAEDFKLVKPNVLISVPRVYERIYAKLTEALSSKGKIASALFNSTVDVGWRAFCKKNNISARGGIPLFDFLFKASIGKKIARKLSDQFGGRLRVAISGGAALNPKAAKVFCGLGLPVIQGYGMTETSPIISGNKVENNDPATVGYPLKDVQVRIGEKDEIQVAGDLVMKGYWNRPQATKEAFTEDGWLKTGDQGRFDEAGRLRIVGRIKEILVTSTGEKIAPVDVESAIETLPLVSQAFAVGDGKPYVAALLSLSKDKWEAFAKALGVSSEKASLELPSVRQKILHEVRAACAGLPAYALPKNVSLTLDEWNIDNGFLTPTLKLKRAPLRERYGALLEGMYHGARKGG